MARARNIKPSILKNEILGTADPLFTILFQGLWMLADREGRLEDRPLRIKGEVFPLRESVDVEAMLGWLAEKEFIVRYETKGRKCIQIVNFLKHQNPHRNEPPSEFEGPPAPANGRRASAKGRRASTKGRSASANGGSTPASSLIPSSLNPESPLSESLSCSEPASPPSEPDASALPEHVAMEFPTVGGGSKTWPLSFAKLEEYRESFPGANVEGELRKARQWAIDNPQKRKTPAGMPKFLSGWLGRAQDCGGQAHGPAPPGSDHTANVRAAMEKVDRERREREANRG